MGKTKHKSNGSKRKSKESKSDSNGEMSSVRALLFPTSTTKHIARPFQYVSLNIASTNYLEDRAVQRFGQRGDDANSSFIIDHDPEFSFATALQEHTEELERVLSHEQCKIMREFCFILAASLVNAEYCRQSKFQGYIEEHFESLGRMECIENFVCAYREEFLKSKEERNVKRLWTLVAALAHWLKIVPRSFGCDDEWGLLRWCGLIKVTGSMALSAFDQLDKIG